MTKLEALQEQLKKASTRLEEVLQAPKNDISRDSAIQRFEFTLDLSWKTIKTFLEDKKGIIVTSPKDCFREAYRQKLITYNDAWIEFVDMRNETVHTYQEEIAQKIYAELPNALKHFKDLIVELNKAVYKK